MESTERAQIRLILEHERLAVQASCRERLQSLYATNSASGRLQSGATVKEGMRIIDDLGEAFVKASVDQVATVAMDLESFAMVMEEVESLFRMFDEEVVALTNMATGWTANDGRQQSVARATQESFDEARARAKRQLEIHRFTFTKPSSPRLLQNTVCLEPSNPRVAAAKPVRAQVGRLPADWWDDLWIEIFRQVHLGDLKPKSQADIVRAMQQWLSEKDIEAADSTLKPRARKLLQMLKEIDC